MLGELFGVREELDAELDVFGGRGTAWARSRDGERHDTSVGHLDEGLRAGPDDGEVRTRGVDELEVVHVGARVDGPQDPVDVERGRRALEVEPLREDDLEDLAVDDGLLALTDGFLELLARGAELELGLGGVDQDAWHVDPTCPCSGDEASLHVVETPHGVGVRLVHAVDGVVEVDRVGDEPHAAVHVVDDGEVAREAQRHLRDAELVGRRGGQGGLPASHDVPAERSDEPSGERREPVDRFGVQDPQRRLEDLEGVARGRDACRDVSVPDRQVTVDGEGRPRGDTDE